jgi:hypothetical protein
MVAVVVVFLNKLSLLQTVADIRQECLPLLHVACHGGDA